MISIDTGILDNDNKGKSGRGTKFWMEITVGTEVSRYEYFLMDVLDGTFNRAEIVAPHVAKAAELAKADEEKRELEKKQALEKRKAGVSINAALEALMNTAVQQNQKAVSEFLAGKEKALNSIVGSVLKQAKETGLTFDAFVVTTALKQKLNPTSAVSS